VAAVQPMDEIRIQKHATVKYKVGGLPNQMETVIEKPTLEQIYSLDAMVSPFVMGPQITPLVEHLPVDRGEIWATTAINMLAQTSIVLAQKVTSGFWATTGDPQNWLLANILVAARQNPELKTKLKELIASL
jgi:UTP-glucose-1-phosphate uridylyltransferase